MIEKQTANDQSLKQNTPFQNNTDVNEAPVAIAVVGTSMISNTFIESVEQTSLAEVAGVFSRHTEKAKAYQKEHSTYKVWETYEDVLHDADVDALYIASPNAFHFTQAKEALEAKKHVLLEKPLTPTIQEAKTLVKIARDNNVVLQEAMRFMYDPGTEQLQEALKKIGPVRGGSFSFGKKSSRYDELLAGHITNIFCPRMAGGALMDTGVYPINAMVALFGEPSDVSSFAVTVNNAELVAKVGGDVSSCSIEGGAIPPVIDISGSAIFTYEDKTFTCSWTKCTDAYGENFGGGVIEGEQGTLRWTKIPEPNDIVIHYHDGRIENIKALCCPTSEASKGDVNNMKFEIEAFAKRVREVQITGRAASIPENQITEIVCGIIENIRLNSGVVFPSDKEHMHA